MQEKESVKKEKQQLIRDRRVKLTEIKRLEFKKNRLEEVRSVPYSLAQIDNDPFQNSVNHYLMIKKTFVQIPVGRMGIQGGTLAEFY